MKIILCSIAAILLVLNQSFGQDYSNELRAIKVNKMVKDFPDEFDLSSPLKSRVSLGYIWAKGTDALYSKIKVKRQQIFFSDTVPNSDRSENAKSFYLNSNILEVIYYKDSIACAISKNSESRYTVEYFELDENQWLLIGGDPCNSQKECHQMFERALSPLIADFKKSRLIAQMPQDTMSFINYLEKKSSDPTDFILDKLEKHKLVMFGEIHRRKVSWDFCRDVVNDKEFAKNTGVIFLEFGSNNQKDIDQFLTNDTIDEELLLNIFREYIVGGWTDKGRFDFIIDIWKLNRSLSPDKRIKIVLVDTPRPFSTFNSREDMRTNDRKYDRNEYMAKTIKDYLYVSEDKRNALFIVGVAHLYYNEKSAGAILSKEMEVDTYSFFTHCPRMDNFRKIPFRIRHGMFDYAFYKMGDQPLAFELKGSPFGKEPFDGLYYDGSGLYQENYDAYIFFGSLDNEPNGEILFDIFNEDFINETNRILGFSNTNLKDYWSLKEESVEGIVELFLKDHPKNRWQRIIKPLENGKIVVENNIP